MSKVAPERDGVARTAPAFGATEYPPGFPPKPDVPSSWPRSFQPQAAAQFRNPTYALQVGRRHASVTKDKMNARLSTTRDKDMMWSSDGVISSDEGTWDETLPPSPSPTGIMWKAGHTCAGEPPARPLSPASARIDAVMERSSAPATAHSAPSSCAGAWSDEHVDLDKGNDEATRDHWERERTVSTIVPKLESADDVKLNDMTAVPVLSNVAHDTPEIKQKRPRGRPRKNPPITAVSTSNKIKKGRSKTGCITCRRRKKKCDEAKPRCMNCERNAVVCEGYHERQRWKSGREKAEQARVQQEMQPVVTMQPIFHGVETVEDVILWKHYITHLSNVLTAEGEAKNAFRDIVLPLANQHQGLMHSILAVSSKHMDLESPYGCKILKDNPAATPESLLQRGGHHHEEALKRLYKDMEAPADKNDATYATVLAARYGQMLCLLLQTRAEGNPRGEHRVHLHAYQSLIQHFPPENEVFHSFITEFFQYHIFADELLWSSGTRSRLLSSEGLLRHVSIPTPRLIGVGDGLFRCLSQITSLRDVIRANMSAFVDPVVDYTSLYRAAEIDAAIRDWTPRWPPNDSRHRVGPLYRQMMWVYLFRTIYPPSPSPSSLRRSTFTMTGASHPNQGHMSSMQRRCSMVASVGSSATWSTMSPSGMSHGPHSTHGCPSSRNHSRAGSMREQDSASSRPDRAQCCSRRLSPPPARKPAQHDSRIHFAVEESLAILESFKPSDPAQTLLLIPCVVIGTACFQAEQRQRLKAAVKAIRGYTGLRNCDRVAELLDEVWSKMDQGDWVAVWDWQVIAKDLGLDFICA